MIKRKKVLNGIDRIDTASELLRGKRIALVANANAVNRQGTATYNVIKDKYELNLLISPRGGFYTDMNEGSDDSFVEHTVGIRSVSPLDRHGENTIKAMSDIDVVIYDLQNIGIRRCCCIESLVEAMACCAQTNKELLVLDRINPIGGVDIEGAVANNNEANCGLQIPYRFGLTVGELAKYINEEAKIKCKLNVIPCSGWSRRMYADETDLMWVNPLSGVSSIDTALNCCATEIFDGTNISNGEGTDKTYNVVGAPFVDSKLLQERMAGQKHRGVIFRCVCFMPKYGKYVNECCHGVELHVTDRKAYNPFEVMLYLFREFSYYREFEAQYNEVCNSFGNDGLFGEYIDPEKILSDTKKQQSEYRKKATKYLMY